MYSAYSVHYTCGLYYRCRRDLTVTKIKMVSIYVHVLCLTVHMIRPLQISLKFRKPKWYIKY